MKQWTILFIYAIILSCSDNTSNSNGPSVPNIIDRNKSIAITNVNIIPMHIETVQANQTIVIKDGIIDQIAHTDSIILSDSIEVIDGTNRFLIPGLIDMHVHLSSSLNSNLQDLLLFVANGITTVREMWGNQARLQLRNNVRTNNLDAPNIYSSSPGMNGLGGAWAAFTPEILTVEQATQTVINHKKAGYDFIKVYNTLSLTLYNAIIQEAARQNIRVIGHVPRAVTPEHVIASNQESVEHLLGFAYHAADNLSIYTGNLNMTLMEDLVIKYRNAGMWITPTIAVNSNSPEDISNIRTSKVWFRVSNTMRNTFLNGFWQGNTSSAKTIENYYAVTKLVRMNNAKILAGTDAGFGYMLPGFSMFDELEHLHNAGLTPFETLETATINPGTFLETEQKVGSIQVGKVADLILMDNNPLDDITHLRERVGVILRGKWMSDAHLN